MDMVMKHDNPSHGREEVVARFLEASDVVLVGASAGGKDPHSFNARMTRSLLRSAPGRLQLVSRSGGELDGLPVHGSLSELELTGHELAVVVVPRHALIDTLNDCRSHGLSSCLVITGNLTETDRQELDGLVRGGMNVWGPNCVGFTSAWSGLRAIAGDARVKSTAPGEVGDDDRDGPRFAVVGQSGGALANIAILLRREGLDISYFLNTGEEADVTVEDCLMFLLRDSTVDGCVTFLEAPRRPGLFRAAARRFAAAGKPLVVVKVGRTAKSRAVALTHTGAIVGGWQEFAAACEADGVVVCSSWEEAADVCSVIGRWRGRRPGRNVAVFTSSGASGALACDLLEVNGMSLAPMEERSRAALRELAVVPDAGLNPFDSTQGGSTKRSLPGYLTALQSDATVDVLALLHVGRVYSQDIVAGLTSQVVEAPVAVAWGGITEEAGDARARLLHAGIPVFEDPGRLFRALGHAASAVARPGALDDLTDQRRIASELSPSELLSYRDSTVLIEAWGLPRPATVTVTSVEEATTRALSGELTLPCVAKGGDSSGHKVLKQQVRLNLGSVAAVTEAVESLLRTNSRVLLEQEIGGNIDVFVSARLTDFGRLVVVGSGGAWAEAPGMVGALMEPFTEGDVVRLMESLPLGRALAATGSSDVALATIAKVAIRCASRLDAEGVHEIEINPLRLDGESVWCLDAKVTTLLGAPSIG